MGTNNFHNVNASKIFAVELTDEWAYDYLIENLQNAFEAKYDKFMVRLDEWDKDALRSYASKIIVQIDGTPKAYNVFSVFPVIDIVIRNGYYEGVNLDYKIKYNIYDEIFENIDDFFADELCYIDYDISKKQAERYEKWIKKYFENYVPILIDEIESIFADYSDPLICVAQFSNGNAMYAQAETD